MLAKRLLPLVGDRDIRSVTRAEMRRLLDGLGMGVGANRIHSNLSKFFKWASANDYIEISPMIGIDKPFDEVSRQRRLSDTELARVWHAAGALGAYPGGLIKLLILTAQRRDECARARWDEIDLGQKVWTIPGDRVKNSMTHDVPLSPQAIAVLEALPRTNSGFVFPGRRTQKDVPLSGYSKIKVALDRRVDELAVEAGDVGPDGKAKPMEPWRLHDLRRTAGTGMVALGISMMTLSRVLNHAEGGVTKIYARHGFLEEKRAALARWGAHVERLVNPDAGRDNVVPLTAVAR